MRPWGDPGTLILLRVGGANAALLALQKKVWAALLTIPFGAYAGLRMTY
jgi:hypothetical protein